MVKRLNVMNEKIGGEPPVSRTPNGEDIALAPPVALGTMLFSLVEPNTDHAADFARWYERDHFFAGCMAGADFFSGRRFVATRDLKQHRIGAGLTDDHAVDDGSFLHLYWILQGRRDEALSWSVDQVRRLARQGRMGPPTRSISTGFYDYVGGHFSSAQPIPAELALEYPYTRATALLIDKAEGADTHSFRNELERRLAPLHTHPRSMVLWFRPIQLPSNAPRIATPVPQAELDRRWLIVAFSDANQQDSDMRAIRSLGAAMSATQLGTLRLAAPFRPITPGIDDYSDRL
ncbi:hypothetical protein KC8_05385 [Sphingomonas sp. KC8]|nr:hypothetical protein KC8_05385 [Sphingomonas sp. KC8]